MKLFRLVGTEGSMRLRAHSNLDAGARWKGDPNFYGIGTLTQIEEIEGGKTISYIPSYTKRETTQRHTVSQKREPVRVTFSF